MNLPTLNAEQKRNLALKAALPALGGSLVFVLALNGSVVILSAALALTVALGIFLLVKRWDE